MLIIKKETVEVDQLEDIVCNKCGQSLKGYADFEGLENADVFCGYDSKHFGDGTQLCFSLCEACLFELNKTFKHSMIQGSTDDSP